VIAFLFILLTSQNQSVFNETS